MVEGGTIASPTAPALRDNSIAEMRGGEFELDCGFDEDPCRGVMRLEHNSRLRLYDGGPTYFGALLLCRADCEPQDQPVIEVLGGNLAGPCPSCPNPLDQGTGHLMVDIGDVRVFGGSIGPFDASGRGGPVTVELRGGVFDSTDGAALIASAGVFPVTVSVLEGTFAMGWSWETRAGSELNLLGGSMSTSLLALDDSVVNLSGSFNLPDGEVAALSGTVDGSLATGDPFFLDFERASTAQLLLNGIPDSDGDGVVDTFDNCPDTPNFDQADSDGDLIGDACNQARDADGDEWADSLDNCPADPNPIQLDADLDLVGDACDLCPDYPSTNTDFDANGIGDECECGDQTMDGVVNVTDLLAINDVIFGAVPASPLCDANNDGLCNVADILGANAKIFGAPAYCERYPAP